MLATWLKSSAVDLDMEEVRRPALNGICITVIVISWVWATAAATVQKQPPVMAPIIPPLLLLLLAMVCLAPIKLALRWRSRVFLYGLGGAFLLGIVLDPHPFWLYGQVLILTISGLLAGPNTSFALCFLLTVGSVLGVRHVGAPYTTGDLFRALAILWATAFVSWQSLRNLYLKLGWALDSQTRAWETANEVRLRRGQLRRAVDSLKLTHSILERTIHELQLAREEAEEARRVKSRFVANVSHELRTPLNIIVGFAEMICLSPEAYGDLIWPPALRDDLFSIWRNAEHLLHMVDDVLELAQIEAQRLPIAAEPCDLVRLVRDTLATAGGLLRDSHLELQMSLPDALPLVEADNTRIRQVILNLVSNAVRWTHRGYIEVGVYQAGHEVVVYVRDSGQGIPANRLEAIFEEFEQADTSLRRSQQGVGLGLAICRHLVRLHGGRIWVESTVGTGSKFSFALPIPEELDARRSLPLRATPALRAAPYEEEGVGVVLGHDELALRTLRRACEHLPLVTADSVAQAAALVREKHPKLAVIVADSLDHFQAAVAEGVALLQAARPIDLPVVVCDVVTERYVGHTLGVPELLIKPVTRQEVVAAIARLTGQPRKVLVVDDEPDMLRLLGAMVKQEWAGAEVIAASSGAEAIERVKEKPDVMLLDLLMPGVNGVEVLRAVRASPDTSAIPVIVITARGPTEDMTAIHPGEVHILKNSAFTPGEVTRLLDFLAGSLPPRYVGSAVEQANEALHQLGGPDGLF